VFKLFCSFLINVQFFWWQLCSIRNTFGFRHVLFPQKGHCTGLIRIIKSVGVSRPILILVIEVYQWNITMFRWTPTIKLNVLKIITFFISQVGWEPNGWKGRSMFTLQHKYIVCKCLLVYTICMCVFIYVDMFVYSMYNCTCMHCTCLCTVYVFVFTYILILVCSTQISVSAWHNLHLFLYFSGCVCCQSLVELFSHLLAFLTIYNLWYNYETLRRSGSTAIGYHLPNLIIILTDIKDSLLLNENNNNWCIRFKVDSRNKLVKATANRIVLT